MAPARSSRSLTIVAAGILVTVSIGAAYYLYSYQQGRLRYFTQSRMRGLGVLADEIESAIDSRRSSIENTIRDRQVQFPIADGTPSTNRQSIRPCSQYETIVVWPNAAVAIRETNPLEDGSTTREGAGTLKRNAALHLAYDGWCTETSLADVIAPFITGDEFEGVDLFLAKDEAVVFEQGGSNLRVSALTDGREAKESDKDDKKECCNQDDKKGPTPIPAALPPLRELADVSAVHDVEIGGTLYKLFTHPVRIPTDDRWVLGALVPARRFSADVRQMSFGALAYVPLLLVVAILSVPVLKIWMIGKRDRLRARDVRLAAIAMIVGAALLTVLGLDAYYNARVQQALDEQLRRISQSMQDHLRQELTDAVAALRSFTSQRALPQALRSEEPTGPQGKWCVPKSAAPMRRTLLFDRFHATSPIGIRPAVYDVARVAGDDLPPLRSADDAAVRGLIGNLWEQYRYFDMLVWMDGCGQQWEKWTTQSQTTAMINTASFAFFGDATTGRLWEMRTRQGEGGGSAGRQNGGDGTNVSRFALHFQISPNTGKLVPVLALPMIYEDKTIGAAVMVPELMSVIDPVLPAGFGFAIIQNDGRVVLHSIQHRSLYENFFEETSAPRAIRSLMEARGAGLLEADYHGRRARFWVSPIEDSPWTLILFRDKELARAVQLDIVMTWAALALAGFALFLVMRTVLRVALPKDQPDWIWPDSDRRAAYHDCLLALLVTAAGFAGVIAASDAQPLAAMAGGAIIVVASLAGTYLCLAPASTAAKFDGRKWRRGFAIFLLLIAWVSWAFTLAQPPAWVLTLGQTPVALLVAIVLGVASATARSTRAQARPLSWRTHAGLDLLLAIGCVCGVLLAPLLMSVVFAVLAAAALALFGWHMLAAIDGNPVGEDRARLSQGDAGWQFAYVGIGLAALLVLAILPAALLYHDAFETGMEIFGRLGELKLSEALDRRQERVLRQYAEPDNRFLTDDRLRRDWDSIPIHAVDGNRIDGAAAYPDPPPSRWWQTVCGLTCDATHSDTAMDQPSTGIAPLLCGLESQHLSSLLMASLPTYHPESMQLRGMAAQQAADLRWLWSPLPDDHAVFSWKRPRAGRLFAPSGFDDAAALPEIRSLERRPLWLAVLGIVSFALALFWVLVRWLAGRVFGLNRRAAKAPAPPASAQIASGLFVANPNLEICPQSAIFEVVDFRSVDMASSEWRAQIANSKKPGVVLQHLEERFSDPDRRRGKLELLEELIVGCSKLIVVISQIEPLGHLSRRLHSHWDVKADEEISTELIARWARVLERLAWVGPECCVENEPQLARLLWQMYDLRTKATELTAAKLREEAGQSATLVDECQYTARLLGIGWELQTLDEGATADAKDVDAMRRRVANAARAHYQSGWCLLTDEEQLVLVQLANEGFVNPQSWSIVRILVRKGLVRFETAAVRVMNETFRRFVETVEPPEQIKDWERADGASAWDRARHGILLLLIAGGLVLFFTQPEELTRWVGVLTAIGSAAATVMTLFGFFGGARGVPARMT